MANLFSRRRARWAAPVAVAGAIAVGSWLAIGPADASTPSLPPLTAAQVLAKAAHPHVAGFSGTVELTSNLGLPDLSSVTSEGGQGVHGSAGFDPTSLLTGTHDIKVWSNGADEQRLQLPSDDAETDLVRSGDQAWLYDSGAQTVTHYVGPTGSGAHRSDPSSAARGGMAVTPQEAAQRFLDHVDPSTTVTVDSPVYVAGRSAYQVTFAPKAGTPGAAASTISGLTMRVDSATGMVLSVAVDSGRTAALSLAFTSLDLGTPASSVFTPPVGRTTTTKQLGGHTGTHRANPGGPLRHGPSTQRIGGTPTVGGSPWAQVVRFHVHLTPKATSQLDQVSTPDGAGRLVHTTLFNALVEPDGSVVAGFVTPAVLDAAAAPGT